MCEVLREPMTMPPTMPANTPDNGGAPEASAMPRHNGRATRKTTSPEAKLDLNRLPKGCFFCWGFMVRGTPDVCVCLCVCFLYG